MKSPFLILALSLSLLGCAASTQTIEYTSANEHRTNKVPADQIQIFETQSLKREYKLIGVIATKEDDGTAAFARLREKASDLGGDALLDVQRITNTDKESHPIGAFDDVPNAKWTGKVIAWN